MDKVIIKTCNVTNKDNVLVQIPKWVVDLWQLQVGDKLTMEMGDGGTAVVIKRGAIINAEI